MHTATGSTMTPGGCGYRIGAMSRAPKDTRSAAEKDRDTAGIVGNLKHEGYVPTPEAEAVHQRVARGEITAEEAIEIFRQRALKLDAELNARKRRIERA
jgi:type V secretory pathway adhesin AidA